MGRCLSGWRIELWNSGELSSLERNHWHRESGEASRVGNVEYEEKRQNPTGPNTDGAEKEEKEWLLSHSKARTELAKPK